MAISSFSSFSPSRPISLKPAEKTRTFLVPFWPISFKMVLTAGAGIARTAISGVSGRSL